ncbi:MULTISPECIES: hypothetical protein [Nostoc]|jgi:hypothetical protein|uniref:Uncharacterized protein n=1 Tax=Nostoc punctiforme FACHB-252 TaxID=1357509 RepID=A0ABR8H559_NOSPU|nr:MULTISPECIES: hypothetical protein [Nostoc]MBL1198436.1 hypothetical protein [Nostoc sp. GBBB01]MDZ8014732.1 hypothetical protein [Nostoc sp. ZfuVER08]PHK46333.1 hypothetical protein VF13_11570 [Nostoc linckia z16]MBD2610659.1 hypothetical protein [Nostoc punctiforme FACHB-252]PHJ67902.1 hypothetical protein VF02_03900 [Nostoc linckia z1]
MSNLRSDLNALTDELRNRRRGYDGSRDQGGVSYSENNHNDHSHDEHDHDDHDDDHHDICDDDDGNGNCDD